MVGRCIQFVRYLQKHTCAVAGTGIATSGSSVGEVDEDLEGLRHDCMGGHAIERRDEPESARIVLVFRIVQTLSWW
jgi:hypothetical protein